MSKIDDVRAEMVAAMKAKNKERKDALSAILTALKNVECIAAVPVGITKYRDSLKKLEPFCKETANAVLDIIDRFGDECVEKYGERRVYAADEFYLLSGRDMPEAEFYGEFLQLENGVGLWSLLLKEATEAISETDYKLEKMRKITLITGKAAYPLITEIVDKCKQKWDNLDCKVFAIENNYFGPLITVAGLVTATDILEQISDKDLGQEVLIPAVMLRNEKDMFLDSVTVDELSNKLNVPITYVENDGYQLVDAILEQSGLRNELVSEKTLEADIRLENLEEFKTITKNYEENKGIVSLDEFLNEISLVSDVEEYRNREDVVTLMTIHSAKGLEFNNVFLIGLEEGIFPHQAAFFDNNELEEERRLCYVAITRAKKNLWMLNAKRRMLFGNTQVNMPSRFMDEIDSKYLDTENNRVTIVNKIASFCKEEKFRTEDVDYQIGDHVRHDEFGEGVVITVDKSLVTIAFPHPYGIKKIMKKHKSISKV